MQEMQDLENEQAHVDEIIAREKFKMFMFRWKVMSKVNKMKLLDRDSYDFMKLSLEV